MKIFVTGTDTNIGKTVVSSWLCLHSGFDYIKPIQTGGSSERDCLQVQQLSPMTTIHSETYLLQAPLSPHLAASKENCEIKIENIILPKVENLIIEGAGGVLVPLNSKMLMIEYIKKLDIAVIVVARTSLGTINHTLLTLESLRARKISVLGVILKGNNNPDNARAIAKYGNVKILACLPHFDILSGEILKKFLSSHTLTKILNCGG